MMKKNWLRRWLCALLLAPVLGSIVSWGEMARADSLECRHIMTERRPAGFPSMNDEINYTNLYLSCWQEAVLGQHVTAGRSFLGQGVQLIGNPAFLGAYIFSAQLCGNGVGGFKPYACWISPRNTSAGISLEEAIRRESPKYLFAQPQMNSDGTEDAHFVFCANDDPNLPREFNPNCKRGQSLTIHEYARADVDNDGVEDSVVLFTFGDNTERARFCYAAVLSRARDDQLITIRSVTEPGRCK